MNRGQLRAALRERLDDTVAKYLWSDEEMNRLLGNAEREAAERARLLRDETTDAITKITTVVDQAIYPLSDRVFAIDWLQEEATGEPIPITSMSVIHSRFSDWKARRASRPDAYVIEVTPGERLQLRLFPAPSEADVILRAAVYRYPRFDMERDEDEPEIHWRHHERMLDGAEAELYRRRDRDTYDPKKADDAEARFTASFGKRIDANVQRQHREQRIETVAMNPTW